MVQLVQYLIEDAMKIYAGHEASVTVNKAIRNADMNHRLEYVNR
jgi:hypothetical protein